MIKEKTIAKEKTNFGMILAVYLLGIFMGALDTGIVTPARTVIQDSLGVDDKTGIWMITIYTLAYAASIPVMGKLADRKGRRTIYLISIFLFGLGSLTCGLSHSFNSFTMLLICRAIQAIGGGGIVPIATAEFGTTFPEEKRGMALGMVGGVYGIANIFGASAGSAVMDIFGVDRWEFIFYVNVPIALFILIAGFICLPNNKDESQLPIDGKGICTLVVMVLCLMYGLKNIDFFNFIDSITDPKVYAFLLGFVALLPLFIYFENRAVDPVMNLKYFTNRKIVMTLIITIITGIVLMGIIFIPQFCENALKVPSGSGGYFVIILGVCAGVGAMSSGKLTDKYGPRLVLSIGFVAAIIGSLIIIFFASREPNKLNVFASLIFIGLGIGFTMGAPLNYMMLGEVDEKESNSALATLSLVRSLGTVVAPAIMVGFITHAAAGMQSELMAVMPTEVKMPELPYAEELSEKMEEQGMEGMPDLDSMTTMEIDMSSNSKNSDFELPEELLDELQNSDVTTITTATKHMAEFMFSEMTPQIEEKIIAGIDEGIGGISSGISQMESTIAKMNKARSGMQQGINGMTTAISKQEAALKELNAGLEGVKMQKAAAEKELSDLRAEYAELSQKPAEERTPEESQRLAQLPGLIGAATGKLAGISQAVDEMTKGAEELQNAINTVSGKRSSLKSSHAQMGTAISGIQKGKAEASSTRDKMEVLKAAIPGAFKEAEENYLKDIDKRSDKIEAVYQSTLNIGFRQIFIMTAIGSLLGLILLALYRESKKQDPALADSPDIR